MNKYVYPTIVSLMLILMIGLITQGPFTTRSLIPDVVAQAQGLCGRESGAAYGLCNAYCVHMECESKEPQASDKACKKVAERFFDITGRLLNCLSY